MKKHRMDLSQRVRYALLAGMAGAFLIPQVAFAAPTGENVVSGGATVTRSGSDTNINSSNANNVIKWSDYSLVHGERVVHDGGAKTNNYLNIVTGANTSNIDGKIEGGKNVYIVNPNGVIFGKNAEVNVGHLHVSTQDTSTVNTAANMANNVSPLSTTAAGISDVVNMGKITADTVEVHGKNIRFLNAANVHTTASPVVLHTDTANGGYAHIGYKSGNVPAVTAYQVNGANATAADNYYQLVADKTEFQNINSDRTKNYMLENDIDFSGTALTPIGDDTTKFTGKLDGNFFQVKNFNVSGGSRAGLFGTTSGARLENFGVVGANITGNTGVSDYAGGIAAYSEGGTQIRNVYVKDTVVDGGTGQHGGIVGGTENTTLDGVYSKATIGDGGGIIGTSATGTNIYNTYSDARFLSRIPASQSMFFIYMIDPDNGTYVENSFATGKFSWNEGNLTGNVSKNTFKIDKSSGQATLVGSGTGGGSMTSVASYSGWGSAINNTGAPGAKWRIYEGRTTPMLTAFMSGTATATYNYRYFKPDGTPKDDTGNTVKSNDGKDITAAYNSYYMKVVDGSTANPTAAGTKANVSFGAGADTSHVVDYVNSSTKDYDRTNGIRNAGTKAMLWSDQDGPNLRGVNVTITPRDVRLDSGTIKPKRMYNGKSDVTKAFRDALTSGSITYSGFTEEDYKGGTVALDFTTGNFKAWTVDGSNNPDKNVGKDKNVKFSGTIGFSGADAGNYMFDGSSLSSLTGKATITKAPLYLTIQKKTADDKIYDGTSVVKDSAMFQTSGSENIKLDKTKTGLTLAQINAGTPTMPDGAIMTGDDDTTRDDVALTNVGGPKYTNEAGVEQLHAGPHKLQYTNVGLTGNDAGNYELYYTPASGTKTAVTGGNVYLDGKIIPRQILRDDFNVYDKTTHAKVDAKKVYDGNDEYTPTSDVYLSSNAVTGGTTGLVERDRNHITFALTGGKGHFAQSDGTTYSKNVRDVEKLAYEVTGHTDDATNYRLSDYYIMDGTTKKALGSTFRATGAGKITPKALTATVVNQHITKVYDAMDDQTDGKRHIIKGDDLVTLSGFVGTESRLNTSTAKYATKNVVLDGSGNPTTQSVSYTASFDAGTGVEADNYTLGTEGVTPIATTKTLTGGYTGTITPRGVTVKFADVTKVYDGTVTNTQITASDLDDGLNKDVLNADSLGVGNLNTTGVTSRYGDKKTATTFAENRNAGSRTVEYAGLTNALGTNYKLDAKQYGDGTITRRRIDPSGFKVRKSDGTLADATKVYDGTDTYNLPSGAYLTGASVSGDTGIVSHDFGKVVFELKSNSPGHFTKDAAGANRTSHVSEARHIAYDVKAKTLDPTNNPLNNYTFGVAGSPRNLETVTDANPAQVTAGGSITPASLRTATQEISKVYDGLTAHTDGNRNPVKGDTVVSFTGWVNNQKRNNTSTAEYATKDVAYDGSGNIAKKSVTYTGQLTGQYADDYQIVDAGNHVISTANGSGATKTVTMNAPITVANAGKITPRKLNIKMGDVSKTYDGTTTNTDSNVTGITDAPQTSVIGTILSGDGITAGALKTAWDNKRSGGTASSSYGNGTGSAFRHNANASNGTPHDVRYTKMDEAFRDAFGATTAGNYTVDQTVYGKGTINRKAIDPNNFDIVDAHGNASHATKVYDGTSNYTVPSNWKLRPDTGLGTGVISADADKINFAIDSNKGAHFTKADNTTRTANAYEVQRVAYNVKATTDNGYEYLLKNYTLNGQNLESGNATATGAGEIKRRTLNVGLAEASGIDKVYDGNAKLIDTATRHHQVFSDDDARANVAYAAGATNANKLVRKKNGYTVDDGAQVTVQGSYADKNVARSGGNVTTKSITYNVKIAGDAGKNYYLTDGSTTVNAETDMNLSATGKITPRDLSGAFKKVTKVYDGTKNVDPSKVGFEIGANGVVSGDAVGLASGHTQEFESENVRGKGTTWPAPDGTRQHNWVNYENLSLTGADAGNYTLSLGAKAKGLGEITPFELNDQSITFTKRQAEKVYDGTKDVKYGDLTGDALKKRHIMSAKVTVGTAPPVDILDDLKLEEAQYDTKDVVGGTQPRVTYRLSYTDPLGKGNFSLGAGVTSFTTKGDGIITPKDVNVTVKSPLTKTYDATRNVAGVAKNAAGETVNKLNDNISLDGLVVGDGMTYTTTAAYDNKNAGTNKTVTYDVKLDAASAGNYTLKFNNAKVSASNPVQNGKNEITKRRVNVTFGDVSKLYDTTTKNNKPIVGTVSAEDAAVLNQDSVGIADGAHKLTKLAGLDSNYGTGDTDETFKKNPNVGTKSVQYAGLRDKMNMNLGGAAANYEFDVNGYGKGSIARRTIDASKFKFKTNAFAEKEYDGTRDVKWQGDKDKIKNYFASSKVEIDGVERDINLKDIDVSTEYSKYRTKDVGVYQMTADGKKYNAKVDYRISFSSHNFDITGLTAGGYIPYEDKGLITPKDVNVTVQSPLTKTYDATENVTAGMVKNAAGETVSDLNKNITFDGLVAGDGTTYTTTARYADKNAGTNKTVTYDVKLDAASAGNYTLKFNNAKVSASNPVQNGKNEITKRRVNVTFGDVSKLYDTTTKNNKPIVGTVSAEDAAVLNTDHAGIVADDTPNNIKNKLQNLVGLDSNYGTGDTDETFKKNPNVGTKSVQYAGLRDKMNMNLGGAAANYEFDVNGYGKGSIARRTIDASKFKFKTNAFAEKEYDGTRDVKWQGDKDKIKNYFASSKVEIDGVERDINLKDIDVSTEYSKYRTKDVGVYQMTADGKKYNAKVDYRISFSSQNFDITGLTAGGYIPYEDKGLITPKDITPYFTKDHIIKEYDGSSRLSDPNKEAIEKTKRLSILVPGDDVTLDVVGRYMDSTRTQEEKNASADTKEDAQVRTNTTAGLSVAYDLKLGGAQKNNYTIGAQGDTGTVYGTGDIYKKTLTVDVERKVKDYDGTAAVNNLTKNDVTFQGMANNESLQLDDDSIKKVKGQYLDSAGNPDANVRRDANRKVLDKAVEYTGLNDALNDLVARDSHSTAKNYRVEGGSRRYTADDGKGRIDPLKFHDPSNDVKMTFAATGPSKTYDRETTVKYKGLGTDKALKNYLTDATVMVGGKARSIKDELEIDPTRTHYDNKNAGTGKTVTYGFTYKGNNFEIADFTKESDVKGEIKRKDVKVLPVDQLWKTYDSERDVYVEGDDSIFTRRGGKQGERVTTGDSVLEVEPDGIISGDVVQNDSWAEFEDENAGTGKKVKYHTSFSGTDAANYRFVDVSGGEITKPLETDNNTIAKRKLNIGFDGLPKVTKAYDTDAKNDKITARITDDSNGSARKVLARDKVHVFGDRLTQLNNTNIQSDYGEGKTDQTFKSDPNAGHKDVQYRGVGKAIRNILGGSADNYETVPDNAYSDGAITKADVSRNEFDPNFTRAHKEYDGTSDVQNLDERYDKEHSFWNAHELDKSNIESLTGSYRGTPAKRGKDVGTNKIVDYTLKLSNRNFNFVGWDGVIQKEGTGDITPREIFEDSRSPLTKVYDGTRNIANVGDDLLTFRHKSGKRPFIKNDDVRNSSTATYDNANVAWKNNVWNQGDGTVGDVNVTYRLKLTGRDAENYKIVSAPGRTIKDSVDQDGTRTQTTDGTGKITPRDIHLKADPQTRWINEGLPKSYTGKPMGSNLGHNDIPELLPNEVLPGSIDYSSPNARLRWGDYMIRGDYHALNGTDGDAVSRNYRFVQDPANASAFHMGPYVPDYEYYKAMTQVSKMTPDEYAYENASLDRRSNFGRDAEAEIDYMPPSINMVKDGVDITQTGIHVTDETVFSLVNEVFGGK